MATFKKGDRVYLPATTERGTIQRVVPKAEGPWAEQFYELAVDGNDLFEATLQENALAAEADAPDWSEADLPDDHPTRSG